MLEHSRAAALEITSMADIPAGTGLGSSGSFTTALLKALHTHKKHLIHPRELAEQACHIEIDLLKEQIGKQDQYIAAYRRADLLRVSAATAQVKAPPLHDLHRDALQPGRQPAAVLHRLLAVGLAGASAIRTDAACSATRRSSRTCTRSRRSRYASAEALERGDLRRFAELLSVQWEHKKRRSRQRNATRHRRWYRLGMAERALGGKLIGAGGGGFLMFYAEDKMRLRHALLMPDCARFASDSISRARRSLLTSGMATLRCARMPAARRKSAAVNIGLQGYRA